MEVSAPRRELLVVFLAAAVLCAWPLRDSLLTGERVVFGVDCATSQLPWAAVLEAPDGEWPRNPATSDQAHGFYPFYRWVSESWRAGDPPLWNPLIYAGVPGLGNPQTGVLDPQVGLLVGLEALFGRAAFDWGLTALAWLRLVFAGTGAWALARVLGLGRPGAALAAAAFAFSGFQLLWLGFSLGAVAPTLPWLLFFLERLRRGGRAGAAVGVVGTTALAILAGHPETTFYVGVAAGLWALALVREDRRTGLFALGALASGALLAAPMVLPFLEYLERSAAQLIRAERSARTTVDLAALGTLAVSIALAARWRRGVADGAGESRFARVAQPLGVGLAAAGVAALLAARGLPSTAPLALLPDLYGLPGDGRGYRGGGSLAEAASAWVPFAALAFAAAALLAPRGHLARRGLVGGLGGIAFLLCSHAPGLLELYRLVPVVGHGAPVRFGVVSALFFGLLAGEAAERSPRTSRRAAAAALVALLALGLAGPAGVAVDPTVPRGPERDELVDFLVEPPLALGAGPYRVEGWIEPRVPVAAARVRVEECAPDGRSLGGPRYSFPAELGPRPPSGVRGDAPPGAVFFACPSLVGRHFDAGAWRLTLEVLDGDGAVVGERRVAVATRSARGRPGAATLAFAAAGLVLLLVPRAGAGLAVAAAVLCFLQGLGFARRVAPGVPREEVFPPTRTEALIARELDGGRYLGDAGVLPPSTGMVRGLRAVDGYDGMDVAAFNHYRTLAVRPGTHALLGWTPRGVDLDGNAFRMLGVTVLATRAPLEHPGWQLFAAPPGSTAHREGRVEEAEVWLYRAREPHPRAFVAGVLASPDELAADLRAWDSLEVATWQGAGELAAPRTEWSVEELSRGNNELRLRVDLDGDGLLVVTEQHFPGWTAEVDGEPAELAAANAIFHGLLLGPGEHEVVLRYRPRSLDLALALAAAGAVAAAVLARGCRAPRGAPDDGAPSLGR